jgi:hypothetical protein
VAQEKVLQLSIFVKVEIPDAVIVNVRSFTLIENGEESVRRPAISESFKEPPTIVLVPPGGKRCHEKQRDFRVR